MSDYPTLRTEWNGILLKQPAEQSRPQYLNIFTDGQQDASYADVKMISSDGVHFLLSRLFLASVSMMFRRIFSDILPLLDDGAEILIQTNIHSDELKLVVQFIMFGQIDCDEKCPHNCKVESVLELLKDFGISLMGNSITLSHSKKSGGPKEEIIRFDNYNENNSTNDNALSVKEEAGLDDSFDELQE